MLKRLVILFELHRAWVPDWDASTLIWWAVENASFVRKGQEQMMCDYLWLELLESGVIK